MLSVDQSTGFVYQVGFTRNGIGISDRDGNRRAALCVIGDPVVIPDLFGQ